MKRLMLIGPSQCGKTSLTQVLRGETLRYQKTQAIVWTPGRRPRSTPRGNIWKTAACTVHCSPAHARPMSSRWY
ncbi:unnamed protein product [Klebsiella pneumoniae subsp. rhinoscleromatis SB3432]|nr:unnamed protein product [Klebsiella pneumoniae subsp. rhinoscleromatis SB3432]